MQQERLELRAPLARWEWLARSGLLGPVAIPASQVRQALLERMVLSGRPARRVP